MLRTLQALSACIVFGQRLVLPVAGGVSFVLIAAYGAAGLLLLRRALREDRLRLSMFFVAVSACCAAALVSVLRSVPLSATSLMFLAAIYAPWTVCIKSRFRPLYQDLLRFFLRLMLMVAVLALAQIAGDLVGLSLPDPFDSLPPSVVAQGFNTTYPIFYGSAIFKANALVMLEPSFLSQFMALAIIVGVTLGVRTWRLFLYGAALICAVSGTGIMLVAVGLAAVALRAPGRIRPGLVLPAIGLVALALMTPAGPLLLDRADELGEPGSSGQLRFLVPYQESLGALAGDPAVVVAGAGPGMADRALQQAATEYSDVVYPVVPKLVFEYGLFAGLMFSAFLAVSVLRGSPLPAVAVSCSLMLFVLSGSLLQPHTVMLAWVLTSLFSTATPARKR